MINLKTPGVFIEEVPRFPSSVAGVATAIPVFIGYTESTVDEEGNPLINNPVRITSFLEFTGLFGGSYSPAEYTVQVDPDDDFRIIETAPTDGKRFYLFEGVRHYYDNGGGPCYIVTVGDYSDDVEYGDPTEGLRGGLQVMEKVDETTLLVAPDSAELNAVEAGNLHKDILSQCGRLKDRFGILDMVDGYLPSGIETDPVGQFRNEAGTENLKYGAVYYPWLRSTYQKNIRFEQLNFEDAEDPPQPVPDGTFNTMTGNPSLDDLVTDLRARITEQERIFSKVTEVELNRTSYNPLSAHLEQLRSEVMAASTAVAVRPAFSALIGFVREMALAFQDLESEESENSSSLDLLIGSLVEDEELSASLVNLIGFEKNENVRNSIATDREVTDVESDYTSLDGEEWIGEVTVGSIAVDSTDYSSESIAEIAQTAANSPVLQSAFDSIAQAYTSIIKEVLFLTERAEKNLFTQHPFFKTVLERVSKDMSLLPPSGAVAGIYATVDRTRGVWKAPANMSLRSVIGPAFKLTDGDQTSLNVHETGKSINAIRAFTGKGILVWGTRTLAGNNNEWKYINVRRFFSYVEESAKKASEPFVFESNDAGTWIRVRAMIENFLTTQWRQGALAGATSNEAFYVKVGLDETMTQQDILEGRMIVEIGMAAVRPAEFIVLRFSHKMQES